MATWGEGELRSENQHRCYLSDTSGPLEKGLEVGGLKTPPWEVWGVSQC